MTENLSNYISPEEELGIIRTKRDLPPAHYTFKIESFSSLVNLRRDYVESRDFEVDGYKWKLLFYPNGNKKRNSEGHVSMYLVFSESNKPSDGWEVRVNYRFLVYNQIQDKYFTIEDGGGRTKRFYTMKTEWGIDNLLSLEFFKDPSNGCLIDDCCVLGTEISVIKSNGGYGESLSFTKLIPDNTFTWKIDNFPTLTLESYTSETFIIGEQKWKLSIYPKGDRHTRDKSLSLCLDLQADHTLDSGSKVYAECVLKIKDQIQGQYLEKPAAAHFTFEQPSRGYLNMLPLIELNLPSNGYMKENALVVEIQFNVVSKVQDLPISL